MWLNYDYPRMLWRVLRRSLVRLARREVPLAWQPRIDQAHLLFSGFHPSLGCDHFLSEFKALDRPVNSRISHGSSFGILGGAGVLAVAAEHAC